MVRLTSGPSIEFGPAISPDGKWVAYLSNARGPFDVWVKFLSGGEPVNLTGATNLEVTNNLEMDPPVHCRVLLTTPLESFTIGRTIVLSRGLIDVLPDEASLAAIVAHELGHVMAGHELDTRYAFTDRVLIGDREAVARFQFERTPQEETEADAKAVALLKNSPYKDKLVSAGLFFKALQSEANALPALIQPHFGNGQVYRMAPIVETFDRVWYGHLPIDAESFAAYQRQVEALRRVG